MTDTVIPKDDEEKEIKEVTEVTNDIVEEHYDLSELSDEEFIKHMNNTQTQQVFSDNEPKEESNDIVPDTEENQEDTTKESNTDNSPDSEDTVTKTEEEIDYKALYLEILKPFKAAGKEINVNSVEELRTLAQKGVDYTKKTQQLKPNLKIIKTLEDNGVLEADKVNLMIDLLKGDKNALAQHIKNLGVDPIDIDVDLVNYTQKNYIPSDEDYDFEQKLTDDYSKDEGKLVLNTIRSWDNESQIKVLNDPNIRNTLMDHAKNGIFQEITKEIEKQSILGNLNISVGDAYANIFKEHYDKVTTEKPKEDIKSTPKVIDVKLKTEEIKNNKQSNEKIKSLSGIKTVPSKKTVLSPTEVLNLNDAEFMQYMKKSNK